MLNYTPAMAGWFGYPLELEDRLRLIKGAGFKAVLLWWAVESAYEPPIPQKVETAHRIGLDVANAHLHYKHINSIWLPGIEGERYCNELIGLVASAAAYGVPTLVLHLTRTLTPPDESELGYSRIMRIIDTAERVGVDLAFENLRVPSRLYSLIARVDSNRVGVCFDSGHNHYVCPDTRICRDFKDRIFAVHLHDNFGSADEHLIPFDGNEDWHNIRQELIECSYSGPWSLEIEHTVTKEFRDFPPEYDPYVGMSAEEYLARAFAAHQILVGGDF